MQGLCKAGNELPNALKVNLCFEKGQSQPYIIQEM